VVDVVSLLDDDAGADGAAALADGEAEAGLHGDGLALEVDLMVTLSPGMHISAPPRRLMEPVTSVVRK
jgi:hypothetical protein